ncbi:hypothetical protein CVT25_014263 [Psilocybe cyanescens]|uniref:Uncharacterized protein n=1 Tax=Psilocybe cyanescens TaxID=93625 RepID=A0A409VPA8_PSICY|nr:hypothetical protein CVT25_014263 [Psilocybe cyanescens]
MQPHCLLRSLSWPLCEVLASETSRRGTRAPTVQNVDRYLSALSTSSYSSIGKKPTGLAPEVGVYVGAWNWLPCNSRRAVPAYPEQTGINFQDAYEPTITDFVSLSGTTTFKLPASMIRPPPLELKLDNRFPHPLRTPSKPKSQSFVSQPYKASWKNPIIAVAGLNGLRFAFAAVRHSAFEDAIVDDAEAAENLTKVSIALGVMYTIAFFIELYGIVSVSMQRLGLIRVYLYLTFLASVLITSAGVLNGVSYFLFAEELMWECIGLATEGRGYEKSLFRGRPWPGSVYPVGPHDARKQCVYAWVNHSWSQIASVFLFSLIPAVIYYIMVYTYYRQTIDPKHHANLERNQRQPRSTTREAGNYHQVGYARVANAAPAAHRDDAAASTSGMTTSRSRAQAANPPSARLRAGRAQVQAGRSVRGVTTSTSTSTTNPNASVNATTSKRTFTSRSLQRSHRPPPLMQSPSPFGLSVNLTPGPPTYGPSRVYAAFAAPIASAEYDKFV